jgi:putative transposase
MSRPLRLDLENGWYHAMARGIERRAIVRTDNDREHWRDLLANLPARFGVRVHAWALMDNHYHLQLETPEANLSRAVQWLNVSYAVWFNRKYRRIGPLFAGRFRAQVLDTDKWVAEVNRYIHLNPVRTSAFGLGKRDAAFSKAGHSVVTEQGKVQERLRHLRNYRWSSGRAYLAEEAAPSWLTIDAVRAQFGGRSRKDQIKAYREALHEAIAEGLSEPPWTRAAGGLILGGKQFVEKMKKKLGRPGRESPSPEALLSVPDLSALRDCY